VVIQNITASFIELFPNYVPPVRLCLEKWGVMTPPAPMGVPPLFMALKLLNFGILHLKLTYPKGQMCGA